jgi:hypothetical protein
MFSPETRVLDMMALLDSYAVEIRKNERVYFRSPVCFLQLDRGQGWPVALGAEVDLTVSIELVQFEPDDSDYFPRRSYSTRWPFYVVDPLAIRIRVTDQWSEYHFSPGNIYKDRRDMRRDMRRAQEGL